MSSHQCQKPDLRAQGWGKEALQATTRQPTCQRGISRLGAIHLRGAWRTAWVQLCLAIESYVWAKLFFLTWVAYSMRSACYHVASACASCAQQPSDLASMWYGRWNHHYTREYNRVLACCAEWWIDSNRTRILQYVFNCWMHFHMFEPMTPSYKKVWQ